MHQHKENAKNRFRFKSCLPCNSKNNLEINVDLVTQLVEYDTFNIGVTSSNLVGVTKNN